MTYDYKISKVLNSNNVAIVSIYNFISIYSSLIFCLIIIILFDNTSTKLYVKLIIILSIIVYLLKHLLKKKRPYEKHPDIYNRDLLDNTNSTSFPSMHTMCGTIMSYMIFKQYNIPVIFPIWPILTMISRIGLGVHYASDCILTFIVTLLINFIFYL